MNLDLTEDRIRNRDSIAFPPAMVRAFSGRGAVSLRDHSVTGIQWLQFTPVEQQQFRFHLEFNDLESGCDIADDTDELWDYLVRTGAAYHPLALNWGDEVRRLPATQDRPVRALVLQSSGWAPNLLSRTGTFHKRLRDLATSTSRLVSFGVASEVMCDPIADLVRTRLAVTNRTNELLRLSIRPNLRVIDPLQVAYPMIDCASHPSWHEMVFDATGTEAAAWGRQQAFRVRAEADLPVARESWLLELGPQQTRQFEVVLHLRPLAELDAEPSTTASWEEARRCYGDRHRTAFDRLPTIEATDPRLAQFYDACISTVVESTWHRDNFFLDPFYSAGTWLFALAWDISFSAKTLSLIDPDALRRTLLALIDRGLDEHSYVGWDGTPGHHYSYSLIAGIQALRDYIDVTGDSQVMAATLPESGITVGQRLAQDLRSAHQNRLRQDGLISYGPNSNHFLENRTDGYQGATATISIQITDAACWLARQGWPALDPIEVSALRDAGEKLWDPAAAWYATAVEEDLTELFWSYQVLELLQSDSLAAERKEALASHLVPGTFLGRHGMYSIARTDHTHWDHDDADWGGGGQYTGMPLRIAEALWQAGVDRAAWRVLSGCLSWTEAFPCIPQEIMTDSLATVDLEQAAEIAVGAGVQAVIFGMFGIQPQQNGELRVAPPIPASATPLALRGYRHRDRLLDVELDAECWRARWGCEVFTRSYGEELNLPIPKGPAATDPRPALPEGPRR